MLIDIYLISPKKFPLLRIVLRQAKLILVCFIPLHHQFIWHFGFKTCCEIMWIYCAWCEMICTWLCESFKMYQEFHFVCVNWGHGPPSHFLFKTKQLVWKETASGHSYPFCCFVSSCPLCNRADSYACLHLLAVKMFLKCAGGQEYPGKLSVTL